MAFVIPELLRRLPLTDYAPEFVDEAGKPITLLVLLNPPWPRLQDFDEANRLLMAATAALQKAVKENNPEAVAGATKLISEAGDRMIDFLCLVWRWERDQPLTRADVTTLATSDTDPNLYAWLVKRTLTLIDEHRSAKKKP